MEANRIYLMKWTNGACPTSRTNIKSGTIIGELVLHTYWSCIEKCATVLICLSIRVCTSCAPYWILSRCMSRLIDLLSWYWKIWSSSKSFQLLLLPWNSNAVLSLFLLFFIIILFSTRSSKKIFMDLEIMKPPPPPGQSLSGRWPVESLVQLLRLERRAVQKPGKGFRFHLCLWLGNVQHWEQLLIWWSFCLFPV